MKFFSPKNTSSYSILIALKSSSVDVQLVRVPEHGPREALFSQRKIILLENSQDPERYTKQCLAELTSLLKASAPEIQRLSQGAIARTVITLYAPWFTSYITPISHKDSVVVSEKFLSEQLKTIKTPADLVNLEKKVIKILTNGYSITELTETKFNNISMDVYSSYISKSIQDSLAAAVTSGLPTAGKISYMTSPMLYFNQIKSLLVHEDNATFIFVGGEITEVGIIEDDSLSFYATYPIGKHDFLRELQGQVNSYDYDLLYQKEIVLKQAGQQERLDLLKSQWIGTLSATLASYKPTVPSKLLLISDSKTKDFFGGLLSTHLKEMQGASGQHRIINFDMSLLQDIITYKTPALANELDLQLEALI